MSKPDIHRWVHLIPLSDLTSPNYDQNEKRVRGEDWPCIICGKPVRQKTIAVHMLTSGDLVSSEQDFDNSQGFYYIGPDCAKLLPNSFTFKQKPA